MKVTTYSKDRKIRIDITQGILSNKLCVRAMMLSSITGLHNTAIECNNDELSIGIAVLYTITHMKTKPLYRQTSVPFPK